MDSIVINGGKELKGSVLISGAKNAVLPMMAASLLADGVTTISNVPDLRDTRTMASLIEITGAKVQLNYPEISIDASTVHTLEAPYELVKTMRASFYVLGPILGRFGKAKISLREVLSEEKIEFLLDGSSPSYVDMPIWYTHSIENIGENDLITLFWINEPYNEKDSDTFFEKV